MKRTVALVLGFLLLSPAMVTAADRKAMQEPSGAAASRGLQLKLDLNRASAQELVGVPGIGPRMAQAIVALRTKKGSFTRVEDLLEVTGVKEKKLAAIAPHLVVVPLQSPAAATPAAQSR